MSYNGSGTFVINSTGQPVVTGTVISSSTFNAFTADIGTGLSTAITKNGQTTTTALIPFAFGISAAVSSSFAAGTVAAPSIYLATDTGTGFYRIGANNNGYSVSGTKLLDFSSALLAITGAATVSTTLTASGLVTGNINGGTLPAAVGGESLRLAGANAATNRVLLDSFGGATSVTFRRANTSLAAPSAIQSGDNLVFFSALGYGATAYNGNISGALSCVATENWTDSAIGSKWMVQAAPIGGTTRTTIAEFSSGATALTGTLGVTGAVAIGNTVAVAVAVASTHKVTMVIGGVTYYLLASNV